MINLARLFCLAALCIVVSNCATQPALVAAQPDLSRTEDTFQSDDEGPKSRGPATRRTSASARGSAASQATGSVRNPTDQDWFTPEWYESQKAEADRMKQITNICRC